MRDSSNRDPFQFEPESLDPEDLPDQDGEETPGHIVEDVMNRDVSKDLKEVMSQMHMTPDENLEEALADVDEPDLDGDAGEADSYDSTNLRQSDLAIGARYERIEHEILRRMPEHKIQPSLERVAMAANILGDHRTCTDRCT